MFDARAEIASNGTLTFWENNTRPPVVEDHADTPQARAALVRTVSEVLTREGRAAMQVYVVDPETGPSGLSITADGSVTLVPVPPIPDAAADEGTIRRSELPDPQEPEPSARPAQHVQEPQAAPRPGPALTSAPMQAAAPAAPATNTDAQQEQEPMQGTLAATFSGTARPRAESPAEEGWQGTLNRLSGGVMRLAPGGAEMARRAARKSIRKWFNGHKTVAFVNIKGGASKTTDDYLAAAIFGTVRGGSVLAWDANENKGTLADRALESDHDRTAIDLLHDLDRFQAGGYQHELVQYMRPQGELHFDVLASQNTAGTSAVIDGDGYKALHKTLGSFYRMIFVDTGNSPSGHTWAPAVESADLLVICAINKEDQVRVAAATIDTLKEAGFGDKVANAVFLISNPQNANKERLERTKDVLGTQVRAMVTVPFDRELDDGGRIDWSRLGPATKDAYLLAGQAIAEGL